jgi:hypothetical protein
MWLGIIIFVIAANFSYRFTFHASYFGFCPIIFYARGTTILVIIIRAWFPFLLPDLLPTYKCFGTWRAVNDSGPSFKNCLLTVSCSIYFPSYFGNTSLFIPYWTVGTENPTFSSHGFSEMIGSFPANRPETSWCEKIRVCLQWSIPYRTMANNCDIEITNIGKQGKK